MEPFEVQCPACQKSLRVKQPELVGKRVACPQCKEKFTIVRPAPIEDSPAPELPAAIPETPATADAFVPAEPAVSLGPSIKSDDSVLRNRPKTNPLLIYAAGGGSVLVLIIIFIVRSQMDGAEQARLRSQLSATDRKRVEKLEAEGKSVHLESKDRPVTRPTVDPTPKPPAKEMPLVEQAEALHGRIQDLKRAHKMADAITMLAGQLGRLTSQYRSESITPEEYLEKLEILATVVEETERRLVQKALAGAVALEQPSVDASALEKFVEAYDKAVLAARIKDWKLHDDARDKVHGVARQVLSEHDLGGKKAELEELVVKFSEEYY